MADESTEIHQKANPVMIEVSRGGKLESRHRGAFVICKNSGEIQVSMGDIAKPVFPRSAVKAFQALPLVESGAADAFGFGDKELALACASHNGEKIHIHGVQNMLEKAGLKESDLACGPHWPFDRKSAAELSRSGQKPGAIHNNCSGKHAGMLAFMKYTGQSLGGYTMPERSVQRRISVLLEDFVMEPFDPAHCAIDGCSVPTWSASLKGWATAFARFGSGVGISPERHAACKRLMQACFNEPHLVAGEKRSCSYILEMLKGKAFVKEGAEGVYCGALPELGLGIALKIDDGNGKAADLLMMNLLALVIQEKAEELEKERKHILKNWNGQQVGERRLAMRVQDTIQTSIGLK